MGDRVKVKCIIRESGPFDVTGDKWERYPSFWEDGKRIKNDIAWHAWQVIGLMVVTCRAWLLDSDLDMDRVDLVARLKFDIVDPPYGVIWSYVDVFERKEG